MAPSALAAAFVWSLVGPLWRPLFAGLGSEVSLTALGSLGWVALAGLPRAERPFARVQGQGGERIGAGPLAVVGLALPALALGLGLDLGAGRAPEELIRTGVLALLLVGLLAAAADRARGRFAHGLAWFLAVPVLAIAPALASWGRGDAAAVVALSPLGWTFLRATSPAFAGGPWAALALAAGLYGLAGFGGRAGAGRQPAESALPGGGAAP